MKNTTFQGIGKMAEFKELTALFSQNEPLVVKVGVRSSLAEVVAIWRRGFVTVRFENQITTDVSIIEIEIIKSHSNEK